MKAPLRLTLAQLNPTVGDIEGNTSKIFEVWEANDASTDLVIFPELFLTGYQLEDLAENWSLHADIDGAIKKICIASQKFQSAAIIPTPCILDGKLYNAFMLIETGQIKYIQKKVKLPNIGVFDEPRVFSSDDLPLPIKFRDYKIGFMICEDIWSDDVPLHLANQSADLLISINASPYDSHKKAARLDVCRKATQLTGLSVVYLNLVGGQDELIFDGRSFVMHTNGQIVFQAPSCEEEIIKIDFDLPDINKATQIFHVISGKDTKGLAENVIADIFEAIKLGLKDYVHKNGFRKVLLGLSGGIDSALVACMAVDALGPENVRCIMLPSEFTSTESLEDAEQCAKNLGVKYEIIPIQDAVKTFEKIIPELKGLAHENTQSRIRGLILMALSNINGEMLLSTGNKSELATGYATLYGDMNGGFNPLKDVYKTDIFALAKLRNTQYQQQNVIPARIITKAPSAELRPDQTDQDSLPPYDILDDILCMLIEYEHADWETRSDLKELRNRCLKHPQEIEKVAKLLRASEFKRRQSCPGPKITPRAFGKDRRYPITNKFLNRIEKPKDSGY